MSKFRIITQPTPQDDGSLKGNQTFHPTLDVAVAHMDAHGGRIKETTEVDPTPEAIAAARARNEAKKAAGK